MLGQRMVEDSDPDARVVVDFDEPPWRHFGEEATEHPAAGHACALWVVMEVATRLGVGCSCGGGCTDLFVDGFDRVLPLLPPRKLVPVRMTTN